MQKIFNIGIIVKPQGVRGELKVQPLTDDPKRFLHLNEVLIDGRTYKVLSSRNGGEAVYMWLGGVADRNAAEKLRGKYLCVDRENAVPLQEGRFFIADVLGCTVYDEEESIGIVTDVTSARTDIFTLNGKRGVIRFPFLKDAVESVDVEAGIIRVKGKRFAEIAVYENDKGGQGDL